MHNIFSNSFMDLIQETGAHISVTHVEVEIPSNNPLNSRKLRKFTVNKLEEKNSDCMVIDSTTKRNKRGDRILNLPDLD